MRTPTPAPNPSALSEAIGRTHAAALAVAAKPKREFRTRPATGKQVWPLVLIAGGEKVGKSWAAAEFSASDAIDHTYWIEVGEGRRPVTGDDGEHIDDHYAGDLYGAIPGADFDIVDHNGTFNDICEAIDQAVQQPAANGKVNCIVVDGAGNIWEMLAAEQQEIANARAEALNSSEKKITGDQWSDSKKRWNHMLDLLRTNQGPVLLTSRLDRITTYGTAATPQQEKEWKLRAEKNLPYDVDLVIQIPNVQEFWVTGVRSLKLKVPKTGSLRYEDLTLEEVFIDMGLMPGKTPKNRTEGAPQ